MTENIITLMNDVLKRFNEVEEKFIARFNRIEKRIKKRIERLEVLEKKFKEMDAQVIHLGDVIIDLIKKI